MDLTIYHNPRCRKSRETLQIITDKGIQPTIIEYLKNTPTVAELKSVIDKLGVKPESLVRRGEKLFKENFKGKELTEQEWLDALVQFPDLIERPIVIKGERAVIGRPPENVESFFKMKN